MSKLKLKIRTSYVAVSGTPSNPGCTVHGLTQGEVRYLQVFVHFLGYTHSYLSSEYQHRQKLVVRGKQFLSQLLFQIIIFIAISYSYSGPLHSPTPAHKGDTPWGGAKGKNYLFVFVFVNTVFVCFSFFTFGVNSLNSFHLSICLFYSYYFHINSLN